MSYTYLGHVHRIGTLSTSRYCTIIACNDVLVGSMRNLRDTCQRLSNVRQQEELLLLLLLLLRLSLILIHILRNSQFSFTRALVTVAITFQLDDLIRLINDDTVESSIINCSSLSPSPITIIADSSQDGRRVISSLQTETSDTKLRSCETSFGNIFGLRNDRVSSSGTIGNGALNSSKLICIVQTVSVHIIIDTVSCICYTVLQCRGACCYLQLTLSCLFLQCTLRV